jgi:hypothetical protein
MDTLLDADDGFHKWTIDEMQSEAIAHTHQIERSAVIKTYTTSNTWWVFCVQNHIEWHNRDIILKQQNPDLELGPGIIGIREGEGKICTSAGVTRVALIQQTPSMKPKDTRFPKQAARRHHQFSTKYDKCGQDKVRHCWKRLFLDFLAVIKSRSISSNSMDHMTFKNASSDFSLRPGFEDAEGPLAVAPDTAGLWEMLEHSFGIQRTQVLSTSQYLYEHAAEVAKEQLEVSITPGWHSNAADFRGKTETLKNIMNVANATKMKINQTEG